MSVKSLCKGDIVVRQVETSAVGSIMGVAETLTDGTAYDCTVQVPEKGESAGPTNLYEARGMRIAYEVFFSEDVNLSEQTKLKWTVKGNATLATPKILRVLDYYSEGRPGGDMLWIAECELLSTRPEN